MTTKLLLWVRKLSSNYLHSIQVDMWNSFWDINEYMTKRCPSQKSGKASYSGIVHNVGRPVIHTHHIYVYEHIFFWMLRAQMLRIYSIEMKIWGCTPFSGTISKWLSWRKCRKKMLISVSQQIIITDKHILPLDICFWKWQIPWY